MANTEEIDFTVERCKMLFGQFENMEYLAEIAMLYNRFVEADSQQPVMDMVAILECDMYDLGYSVELAMKHRLLTLPKRGSNGGKITKLALKILRLG